MRVPTLISLLALAACGGPPAAGSGTLEPVDFTGAWSGQWNNTTFDSSGDASMDVTVDEDAGTAEVVLDLDGNVFGGVDPDPVTFDGTYDETGYAVSTTDVVFGEMSLEMSADGDIEGGSEPDSGPDIAELAFDGEGDSVRIDLDYEILTSTGDVFAEGTVVLTHD